MDVLTLFTPRLILGNGQFLDRVVLVFRGDELVEICNSEIEHSADVILNEWISPGWINSHCHLELGHLADQIPEGGGINDFVGHVQALRNRIAFEENTVAKQLDFMYDRGVVLVGDICNGSQTAEAKRAHPMESHSFIELIGTQEAHADEVFSRGLELQNEFHGLSSSLAGHAPYSASNRLLSKINEHQATNPSPTTIHYMESAGERELYESGSGPLHAQLLKFGMPENALRTDGIPSPSALMSTANAVIWVHNTQVTREDFSADEMNNPNWFWCTCPKANRYIERRLPDYALWLEYDLQIVMGTDSLASNDSLDLLDEMRVIQRANPAITTETMISWVTGNAARAFNRPDLGRVAPGVKMDHLTVIGGLSADGDILPHSFTRRLVKHIGKG